VKGAVTGKSSPVFAGVPLSSLSVTFVSVWTPSLQTL